MKNKNLLQIISLFVTIVMISVAGTHVTAQTFSRPVFQVLSDTSNKLAINQKFNVEIYPEADNQKFLLYINNPSEQKLQISISGNEGAGFRDLTHRQQYRKRFDMRQAPDGVYIITVTDNKSTFTKTMNLQTNTVVSRDMNIQ